MVLSASYTIKWQTYYLTYIAMNTFYVVHMCRVICGEWIKVCIQLE